MRVGYAFVSELICDGSSADGYNLEKKRKKVSALLLRVRRVSETLGSSGKFVVSLYIVCLAHLYDLLLCALFQS